MHNINKNFILKKIIIWTNLFNKLLRKKMKNLNTKKLQINKFNYNNKQKMKKNLKISKEN